MELNFLKSKKAQNRALKTNASADYWRKMRLMDAESLASLRTGRTQISSDLQS